MRVQFLYENQKVTKIPKITGFRKGKLQPSQ